MKLFAQAVGDVLTMISIAAAIYRYDVKHK